ncbi:MAG: SHOCT domain-containing protein [Actinomycetota bacterium]|nr:SHOCT domain-containing protein [Actinomycetota bacterium]
MAPGRFRKRDDDPPGDERPGEERSGEERSGGVDLVEALARAREAAAEGSISSGEHRRRVVAALSGATVDELAAAAASLSSALGAAPAEDARIAAVERLVELRAAGAISEENFAREKRRILG